MKPYYSNGGIVLYLGDCREVSPLLTERGIVMFDAPYSEHVHSKSRAGSRKLKGGAKAGAENSPANLSRVVDLGFSSLSAELRQHLALESARLASRWVLSFADVESCHLWRESFVAAKLNYCRTGIWRKIGATPQFTGDRPAAAFETITIAHPKGRKRWNGGGKHGWWDAAPDAGDPSLIYEAPIVLERGRANGEPRIHETRKPESLMVKLIEDFTDPDELVIDFTAGGATTLVCAKRLGRRGVGIEIREEAAEKAAKRIDAEISGVGYHAAEAGQTGFAYS